jgi:hypothetical protein
MLLIPEEQIGEAMFLKKKKKVEDHSIEKCCHVVFKGLAMAEVISRRPVTVEARLPSQVSQCEICGGQIGTRQVFFREMRFSLSIIPLMPHTHLYLYVALTRRTNLPKIKIFFGNREALSRKVVLTFHFF